MQSHSHLRKLSPPQCWLIYNIFVFIHISKIKRSLSPPVCNWFWGMFRTVLLWYTHVKHWKHKNTRYTLMRWGIIGKTYQQGAETPWSLCSINIFLDCHGASCLVFLLCSHVCCLVYQTITVQVLWVKLSTPHRTYTYVLVEGLFWRLCMFNVVVQ